MQFDRKLHDLAGAFTRAHRMILRKAEQKRHAVGTLSLCAERCRREVYPRVEGQTYVDNFREIIHARRRQPPRPFRGVLTRS